MKAIYRLFLYIIMLYPAKGTSQHVLNGSFETNTNPFACSYLLWQPAAFNLIFSDVYLYTRTQGMTQYPYMYVRIDSISTDNTPCSGGTPNPLHPPDGRYSITLNSFKWASDSLYFPSQWMVMYLSLPLTAHKPYTLRFASSSESSAALSSYFIYAGLSNRKDTIQQVINRINPVDSVGYRDYSFSFSPDSAYQYLVFYNFATKEDYANYRGDEHYRYIGNILDNVRLISCVNSNGSKKIFLSSCHSFPFTLTPTQTGTYYYWNTTDTLNQLTVNQPGLYISHTYDNAGCVTIDSFEVAYDSSWTFSTHKDSIVCESTPVQFVSTKVGSYLWNTGDTTQSIVVDSAKTYWVKTTVEAGCLYQIDSFNILFKNLPSLSLPNDTDFCIGNYVIINAYSNNYDHYKWSNGDTTSQLRIVDTGTYVVKASRGYCYIYDTIDVSAYMPPSLNLPLDTSFCKGGYCIIKIHNSDYANFLWSTGSTSDSIIVKDTGTFYVKASNNYCIIYDTVHTYVYIPDTLSLISDTSMCQGTSIILSALHSSYNHYQWNNGDTLPYISASSSGTYKVVANDGVCYTSDSTNVHYYPKRYVNLPKDTAVCFDELKAIILDAGQWKTYSWYPTGEHTRTIAAAYPEIYIVVVTDSNNCTATDTALVEEDCPADLFVPNAFTPNGDAINEFFAPKGKGITSFTMKIYDRWGRLLFESNDIAKGWDGTTKGTACSADVYLYVINYVAKKNNNQKSISGNVTLLR